MTNIIIIMRVLPSQIFGSCVAPWPVQRVGGLTKNTNYDPHRHTHQRHINIQTLPCTIPDADHERFPVLDPQHVNVLGGDVIKVYVSMVLNKLVVWMSKMI